MTTKQINEIRARIRRGKAWLNKNKRDWQRSVNPDNLTMKNPNYCMLGYCFGDYFNVVSKKKIFGESYADMPDALFGFSERWAVAHGFAAPTFGDSASFEATSNYYEALDTEWKKVLRRFKR